MLPPTDPVAVIRADALLTMVTRRRHPHARRMECAIPSGKPGEIILLIGALGPARAWDSLPLPLAERSKENYRYQVSFGHGPAKKICADQRDLFGPQHLPLVQARHPLVVLMPRHLLTVGKMLRLWMAPPRRHLLKMAQLHSLQAIRWNFPISLASARKDNSINFHNLKKDHLRCLLA